MRKTVALMVGSAVLVLVLVTVLEVRRRPPPRTWRSDHIDMHRNMARDFRGLLKIPDVAKVKKVRDALDRLASWHERRAREWRWIESSSIAFEVTRDAMEMPLPGDFEAFDWASGSSNY